jgi:secondary thiamine-phosphate synthase enzyme
VNQAFFCVGRCAGCSNDLVFVWKLSGGGTHAAGLPGVGARPTTFQTETVQAVTGNRMVISKKLALQTRGNADMHDITAAVAQAVRESGLRSGTVTLFCPSSTSALTTIEFEPGAVSDLQRLFDQLAPPEQCYAHEETWHDGNGHSHVRAALLGASLVVPFVAGQLTLGTWQQIIFVDFDIRPRHREIVAQIMGE